MADGRWVDISSLIEERSRSPFQLLILVSSLALMFVEGYDIQAMAFAAPGIINEWQISKQLFGPVLSASLIGYVAGALVFSVCSDYFGRKVTIVASCFVFSVFTLATAFATSLPVLLLLRILVGIGLGGMIPSLIALNAEYVSPARRGTRISLLFIGYGAGAAFGGFLPWLRWQALFEIGGALSFAACLVAAVALPESYRFLAARTATPKKIAAVLKRARPDFELKGNDQFFLREEGHAGVPVRLLFSDGRAKMTVLLWAAFTFSLFSNYFLVSWLPTVLADGGLAMHGAKTAGGVLMIGSLFGAVLVGMVLDRKGIGALALIFLVSAMLIVTIGFCRASQSFVMVIIFFTGATLIGGQAGLSAFSGILYPTFARSTGIGWALGVGRLGAIAGPTIGGFMLSAGISSRWLFILISLPVIACSVTLFAIMKVRPNEKHAVIAPASLSAASAPSRPL